MPSLPVYVSSLVVEHNAVKNILFRGAAIILDFAILRAFASIACHFQDYTSFLIFGEDMIQKALFVHSRGYQRQAYLVSFFIVFVVAAGFYDTLLWGLDNPGYVLRGHTANGDSLVSQMANSSVYVNFISANISHPDAQNDLDTTFNTNLFAPGLNFTLPGIFTDSFVHLDPPLHPLRTHGNGTLRFWLNDYGLSVGLDPTFMSAGDMISVNSTGTYQSCYPTDAPGDTGTMTWSCNVPNVDGLPLLSNLHGRVLLQWDGEHGMYLEPQQIDNPWNSLGRGAGTGMMKQVFTVTKGSRRHTFLQTVYKATMLSYRPDRLAITEIVDFMNRTINLRSSTYSADVTLVKTLTDNIVYAKGNDTGTTFGIFSQSNSSLFSASTEYINVLGSTTAPLYSVLRYVSTNITLIRSEELSIFDGPAFLNLCPGVAYVNIATGGVVRSTTCRSATPDATLTTQFLGQVDTSAVAIINNAFLGDGTSNLSSVAVSKDGFAWVLNNEDKIDRLLISRGILVGGNRADVKVYVQYTVAAISKLQLILCLIPVVLVLGAYVSTRRPAMSFFKSSFLAAVLATIDTRNSSSYNEPGYITDMPEITVQRIHRQVTLRMADGRTLTSTFSKPQGQVDETQRQVHDPQRRVNEPLVQVHDNEPQRQVHDPQMHEQAEIVKNLLSKIAKDSTSSLRTNPAPE